MQTPPINPISALPRKKGPPYEGVSLSLFFLRPKGECTNVTPSASTRCGSGGSGHLYRLETSNGIWVIKVPISNRSYDIRNIRWEIRNLEIIQKLDPSGMYHNPLVGTVNHSQKVIGFAVAPASISLNDAIQSKHAGLIRLLSGVLDGLKMLHGNDFVHGDVKTTNLLIFETPSGHPTIKLIDFGTLTEHHRDAPLTLLSTYPPPSKCHPLVNGNIECDAVPHIDFYAWALVCLSVISPQARHTTLLSYSQCGIDSLQKIGSCIKKLQEKSTSLSEDDRQIITESIRILTLEAQLLTQSTSTTPITPPALGYGPVADDTTPVMARYP